MLHVFNWILLNKILETESSDKAVLKIYLFIIMILFLKVSVWHLNEFPLGVTWALCTYLSHCLSVLKLHTSFSLQNNNRNQDSFTWKEQWSSALWGEEGQAGWMRESDPSNDKRVCISRYEETFNIEWGSG